jgi:hypothetical protein
MPREGAIYDNAFILLNNGKAPRRPITGKRARARRPPRQQSASAEHLPVSVARIEALP